jgi:hypothetical protein
MEQPLKSISEERFDSAVLAVDRELLKAVDYVAIQDLDRLGRVVRKRLREAIARAQRGFPEPDLTPLPDPDLTPLPDPDLTPL